MEILNKYQYSNIPFLTFQWIPLQKGVYSRSSFFSGAKGTFWNAV